MEDTQIIDLIYDRNQQGLAELDGKYRRLLLSVADGILHSGEDSDCLLYTSPSPRDHG